MNLKISMLAALISLLVYLPSLFCGFVDFDDPIYVVENMVIRSLDGNLLSWAFSQAHAGFWMPFTWISFAVDYKFWGLNPQGYHLTNIVLHAANTGLVVLIADCVLKGASGKIWHKVQGRYLYPAVLLLAALLWGLHPLRVESVAWVTERKDVLNGLFTLGSTFLFLRYAARSEAGERNRNYYILSFFLFVCSLFAKSISVVLPVMFLVIDWYPLGRLKRDTLMALLREKIPFVAVSVLVSIATLLIASRNNILIASEQLGYGIRTIVAGNAIFEYCRLTLLPFGISPMHVIPNPVPYSFAVKAVLVFAASCGCVIVYRKYPWVTTIWLLFVIPLLPVLGFLQNGEQAFASRFTYLPAIPISIAAAFLVGKVYTLAAERKMQAGGVHLALLLLLVLYGGLTQRLIGVWKDTGTMWSRVIELDGLGRAYQERGIFYLNSGRYSDAVNDLSIAITVVEQTGLAPNYNLFAHRGEAFQLAGRHAEAVQDLSMAISLAPYPAFYYHRALALRSLGRQQEAENDFRQAGAEYGKLGWY